MGQSRKIPVIPPIGITEGATALARNVPDFHIMVAHDTGLAELANQCHTTGRRRPVAYNIPEKDDLFRPAGPHVFQDRLEGGKIGMDVG